MRRGWDYRWRDILALLLARLTGWPVRRVHEMLRRFGL